jgi:tRNA pseudouridine38-40 synthase
VLKPHNFKTLGSSRTDARVSAVSYYFQLFIEEPLDENFLPLFNTNLPADIEAVEVKAIDDSFNIIQSPSGKEYRYYFYYGAKKYPFASPFLSYFPVELDIELMKKGMNVFLGKHDFRRYVTQPAENTDTVRTIEQSELRVNSDFAGSMFPPESYMMVFISTGFMRHQIRLMAGQLVHLGSGKITLEALAESLENPGDQRLDYIAPGSGLMLYKTFFT